MIKLNLKKVIKYLFKNYTKISLLLFLFLNILISDILAFENYNTFYVRADIKISNGVVTESNLLMDPLIENKGIERNYEKYSIKGRSDVDTKIDLKYSAEHNALFNLLIAEGLMSLNNKRTLIKGVSHQETVLSYEGLIKYPYEMMREGYMNNYAGYRVEMIVLFAKLKSPDEQQSELKKKHSALIEKIISFFK